MSTPRKDGGPAFPRPAVELHHGGQPGMTLRDWFAGQALAGLLANPGRLDMTSWEEYASEAYIYADEMLERRKE